jgi:ATP sulfurylase
MNKAKFMLLGIGVVGVVGGALAFKAQKFSGAQYCTDTQHSVCPTAKHYNTAASGDQLRCTLVSGANCTTTITVVLAD